MAPSPSSDDATVSGKVHGGTRAPLSRGATVGRYLLLEKLGQGGMGVVYKAYDPELDRAIALKLLRSDGGANAQHRDRLLREAQALARLQHPNVIAVYDVGTFGDDVFIATEFVAGQTLRSWLRQEPRSRRQILDVYLAAGEGLAAAHRAGLVHRDFKPDNVMLGDDGRVRVLDFGLARTAQLEDPPAAPSPRSPDAPTSSELDATAGSGRTSPFPSEARTLRSPPSPSLLDAQLTGVGAIVGTPQFMAPEQHQGEVTDERADQFSFCVSLYWSLYSAFPFAGGTTDELLDAILRGQLAEPTAGVTVPRWLRQVLARGLAARPAQRFSSMSELLAALRADPSIARRRRLRTGAALLAVAAAAIGWRVTRRLEVRACSGAEAKLTDVWDSARRAAVEAAFRKSGKAYAEAALGTVERVFDGYARAWVNMHVDACEATRVRGDQSEELLDLRMTCLANRLTQLKTLSELYAVADASVVEHAAQSAQSLPGLELCADAAALRAPIPPPHDPSTRRGVDEVRGELARANALGLSARIEEGIALARRALSRAEALRYPPVEAEAQVRLGQLYGAHGEHAPATGALHRAFAAALAGHDEEGAARAATGLIQAVGLGQARHEDGDHWAEVAEALAGRLQHRNEILGLLYSQRSLLREEESRYDEALGDATAALELEQRALGPDHYSVAETYKFLGHIHFYRGQHAEALDAYRRALAIQQRTLGPDHPWLVKTLVGIANVDGDLGDHERAVAEYRSALATLERVQPEDPFFATIYNNLGSDLLALGQPREAFDQFQRAFADWQKQLGPSLDTATALDNMGAARLAENRPAEAQRYYRQALEICERKLESNHSMCGLVLSEIGETERQLHRPGEAMAHFQRSLGISEKTLGPKHVQLTVALLGMGRVQLEQKAWSAARPPLERALAILEAQAGDEVDIAQLRFALAQALWPTGERSRAQKLATQAREGYTRAGARSRKQLAEVTAWLGRHRTAHP
jgi:serine/threonine protein kinase/tetratricopeptide (TPR) repeat protein